MKLRISVEGRAYEVDIEVLEEGAAAVTPPAASPTPPPPAPPAAHASPAPAAARPAPRAAGAGDIPSPLAGTVLDVPVSVGQTVAVGDTVIVLEAMKMESNVGSSVAGTVKAIHVKKGDAVQAAQPLLTIG